MTVVALILAVVIGWLVVRLVRPTEGLGPVWAARLLEVALGAGAGVAITSTVYFLSLAVGVSGRWFQLGVELTLVVLLTALVFRRRKVEEGPAKNAGSAGFRYTRYLTAGLGIALLLVMAAHVDMARYSPHGLWDAFAIWNLRARFLTAEGDLWQRAASPLLDHTHPEYPLLLSSSVARTMRLSGDLRSPAAGFGTAVLFFWALIGALVAAVALARNSAAGLLSGFILVATAILLDQSTWQYADTPLSFFFLATLIAMLLAAAAGDGTRPKLLVMAGASAGMAAWTKDEGAPFLLAACASG